MAWATKRFQHIKDVRLLPAGGAALALVSAVPPEDHNDHGLCQAFCLTAHSLEHGTFDAPLPEPIWSNRGDGLGRFDQLLPSGPSNVYLLNTTTAVYCVARLDLTTGVISDYRATHHAWPVPFELRSACHDGQDTPHELTTAMKRGSESVLVHHDLRIPSAYSGCALCATGHANVRRIRQGSAGTRTVLSSHSRSKSIELWDLRKFGSAGALLGERAPIGEPSDDFRCAGNAPDMQCENGIIAAISGGAPGTTYGAKLHVFSASPRRLSAEYILPEIVIDDGHRLSCPLGITLTGRMLTLMADRQRLLRCWVP